VNIIARKIKIKVQDVQAGGDDGEQDCGKDYHACDHQYFICHLIIRKKMKRKGKGGRGKIRESGIHK